MASVRNGLWLSCVAFVACAACGGGGRTAQADVGGSGSAASAPVQQTSTAPASRISACNLLTGEELQRLTGKSFEAGAVTADQSNITRCGWTLTDGSGGVSLAVHIGNADGVLSAYKGMPGMTAVSGLGEQAFWSETLSNFVAKKGDHVVVVDANGIPGNQKAAEELLKTALNRIQ